MKYLKIFSMVLLLAMLGSACKKDSTTSPTNTGGITTTNPIAGNWKVSSFIKDSVDYTSQFNGYIFYCNTNGNMTIQGNGYNYNNCSWHWDDSNYSMCSFHLMGCDSNSCLWYLDDDWNLTNHDSNHCYFSSHNPNHHSTMTWTKN